MNETRQERGWNLENIWRVNVKVHPELATRQTADNDGALHNSRHFRFTFPPINLVAQNRISLHSLQLRGRHVSFLHSQKLFSYVLQCTPEDTSVITRETPIETAYPTNKSLYGEDEPKSDSSVRLEDDQSTDWKEDYDSTLKEASQEVDNPQLLKFVSDFELDDNSAYPILVLGGGGAVALWLVAALLGAIDSIPLIPEVFQLVGLGYTIWFTSRYLIFKKNRDELVGKVEQIKQQVLGSEGD